MYGSAPPKSPLKIYSKINLTNMGPLILRLISQKAGAAESSLRWISRKGASCGILKSPANGCGSTKDGRMMSTMSVSSSGDSSSVLGPPTSNLPSRISPWLMLPPGFEGGDMVYKFYSLAEKKVLSFNKRSSGGGDEEELLEVPADDALCVGSSHGWLALFSKRNGDLFLSNPLSRRHIKLPPIHTLPIPKQNLSGGFGCVHKVIISCSPDDEEECRAMMIFAPDSRLAFCWPGHSTEWSALVHEDEEGKNAVCYEDFVYSSRQKLFFCGRKCDEFEAWDLRDPGSPRMIPMDVSDKSNNFLDEYPYRQSLYVDHCDTWRSLVVAEQSDELYDVTRFVMWRMGPDGFPVKDMWDVDDDESVPYKTFSFDVHKYDGEDRALRYMDRSLDGPLDGLALFIGNNHSFALSAKDFPGLKPNAIYFTDVMEPIPLDVCSDLSYGGHDLGIFNYENRVLSSCYYPCDVQSIKRIQPAPMWFTPTPH